MSRLRDAFVFRLLLNQCLVLWLLALNLFLREAQAGDPTLPADKNALLNFFSATVSFRCSGGFSLQDMFDNTRKKIPEIREERSLFKEDWNPFILLHYRNKFSFSQNCGPNP
jgi:hypothetical protein